MFSFCPSVCTQAERRRGAPQARPRTLIRPHEPQTRGAWCAPGGRASRRAPTCIAAVSHPVSWQVIDWLSDVGARQRHARGPCFVRTNRKFVVHGVRRASLAARPFVHCCRVTPYYIASYRLAEPRRGAPKARPYVFRPRGSCKWVCDPYFPGTNTFFPLMMYRPRGSRSTGVVTFVPERV